MARLIDADKIYDAIERRYQVSSGIEHRCERDFLDLICASDTVDAVEVVRCRDCKHSTLPSLVTQRYGVPWTLTCHNHNSPCNKRNVKCEGFCPYGERKDGGGNGLF